MSCSSAPSRRQRHAEQWIAVAVFVALAFSTRGDGSHKGFGVAPGGLCGVCSSARSSFCGPLLEAWQVPAQYYNGAQEGTEATTIVSGTRQECRANHCVPKGVQPAKAFCLAMAKIQDYQFPVQIVDSMLQLPHTVVATPGKAPPPYKLDAVAAPALEVRLWTEEASGQDAERSNAGLGADTIVQAVVQPADAEYESATVPVAAPEAEDVASSGVVKVWEHHFRRKLLSIRSLAQAPVTPQEEVMRLYAADDTESVLIGMAADGIQNEVQPTTSDPESAATTSFQSLGEAMNSTAPASSPTSATDSQKPLESAVEASPTGAPAASPSSSSTATCNTLAFTTGSISLAIPPYRTIRFTSNMGQCCDACNEDPSCVAWTRVAAGSAQIRGCYLMDTIDNLTNAAAQQNASATQQPVQQLASTSALLLETGTKGQLLDASLYGCPYPELISPAGACVPPPYCNCYSGVCYGSCMTDALAAAISPTDMSLVAAEFSAFDVVSSNSSYRSPEVVTVNITTPPASTGTAASGSATLFAG